MPTYSEHAQHSLDRLCVGLGLDSSRSEFAAIQAQLLTGWADADIPAAPSYLSLIGDDHSPFEYSVAFAGDCTDLRLLFEVQAQTPSALANQQAALAFNQQLAVRYGLSLARFEAIRNLFIADERPGAFSLWHGVRFSSGSPDVKIYLNPQTFGPARALPIMKEALTRLGLFDAIPIIDEVVRSRGGRDELNYFSLDLADKGAARIKVYFRHESATVEDIERIFALAPSHRAGDVADFCSAVAGQSGPFSQKAVTSCFAFTQATSAPMAATFHLPIAHYATDDAAAVTRSADYLRSHGQAEAGDRLLGAVQSFAARPLASGLGVQSYASFRREPAGLRFTAYLSPELFREAETTDSYSRLSASGNRGDEQPRVA